MTRDMCSDGRFELIGKARAKLLEATNIEMCPDEMAALSDILFRCWQMGWLDQLQENRWYELFGTPERAARTMQDKMLIYDLLDQCDTCPHLTDECYKPGAECAMQDYDALLEWLRGDAE